MSIAFAEFFLHRLSGVLELPQAGSPLTGGSFSAPADQGTRTAAGGFDPDGRLLFQHRLTGAHELPQAGSPLTGGMFFAEPQRGDSPSADGGNSAAPRGGGKKEGQPAVFLPLWTPTFPLLLNLAQISYM